MLEVIDSWLAASDQNFNLFIGISTILAFLLLILHSVFTKKLGTQDERTSAINMKVSHIMYYSLLFSICALVVFGSNDLNYLRQYMVLCILFSFLTGASVTVWHYIKEIA